MPATPHVEKHFTGSATVREIVIGMADGLTVPFALAAGLSAAVSTTSVIVTAGLAEIAAGAMAMGLGGYLAAKTDAEHYQTELGREQYEIDNYREHEIGEVEEISGATAWRAPDFNRRSLPSLRTGSASPISSCASNSISRGPIQATRPSALSQSGRPTSRAAWFRSFPTC